MSKETKDYLVTFESTIECHVRASDPNDAKNKASHLIREKYIPVELLFSLIGEPTIAEVDDQTYQE